jgi:hypothetical protein
MTFWELIFVQKIIYTNGSFTIWFEECPFRIPEGHGSNVGGFGFCQMLHQWHYYFRFELKMSHASFPINQ